MDIRTISAHGYVARINITLGANCISLRHTPSGGVILREPCYDGTPYNPFLFGMPILFPQNRISGGQFEFEGRKYVFPINEENTGCHLHGILHSMPFTVTHESEDSISAVYEAECGEYLGFAHKFRIEITYTITEDGLIHKTVVRNLSENAMPCLLAFHTTFNSSPFGTSTSVLVDILREYERNMKNYLPTGVCPEPDEVTRALSCGSFDPKSKPISRHYKAGGDMRMELRSADFKVVYENSANMPFRLIYNGDADGYICLEPQTSLANSPNSPFERTEAGFFSIKPGESETFESKIKVIKTRSIKNEDHEA